MKKQVIFLHFIHGRDHHASHASPAIIGILGGYTGGFFLGGIIENFYKSEDALKQVAAMKYHSHLSKHTFHIFNIICLCIASVSGNCVR